MSTNLTNTNVKNVSTADFKAVIATVNLYVDGIRAGSAAKVSEAFREEATMYGYSDGKLIAGPISNLYDFVTSSGPAPEVTAHLDVLDIAPTIAVVRCDMEGDATGSDYTDFHTLLKQDGEWKIINKVYHQYGV